MIVNLVQNGTSTALEGVGNDFLVFYQTDPLNAVSLAGGLPVTIPAGQLEASVIVQGIDDELPEDNEFVPLSPECVQSLKYVSVSL